jgi:hypothetical protein
MAVTLSRPYSPLRRVLSSPFRTTPKLALIAQGIAVAANVTT